MNLPVGVPQFGHDWPRRRLCWARREQGSVLPCGEQPDPNDGLRLCVKHGRMLRQTPPPPERVRVLE